MVESAAEKAPLGVTERVRPILLQINARKLEDRKLKLEVCLREAYDAYASVLLPTGELESDEVLNSRIPGWVFHNAVEFKWMPYPPQKRERREKVHEDSWIPGAKTIWWATVPVSETTLNHTLGGYRINDFYQGLLEASLAGRMAFWKGEALKRAAGASEDESDSGTSDGLGHESKAAQIRRNLSDFGEPLKSARTKLKLSERKAASELGIERSSLQDHESGRSKPSIGALKRYNKRYGLNLVTNSNKST